MEGWVDLGTAVSVQPVPKAAYRSDFRENTNCCPQRNSNLGPLAQQASMLPLDHCHLSSSMLQQLQLKSAPIRKLSQNGIIAENMKDQLLPAIIFLSVAKQVQPFLVSYQRDSQRIQWYHSCILTWAHYWGVSRSTLLSQHCCKLLAMCTEWMWTKTKICVITQRLMLALVQIRSASIFLAWRR